MTITLKNIKDANSKSSQAWQRILVKVEKGRILNGTPLEEYRVFEVGSGNIQLQYQAPEACNNDVETITIMNSCTINPKMNPKPEQQIATKKFDIFCVEGQIKITEDLSAQPKYPFSHMILPQCGYSGGVKKKSPGFISFRLKPTKDPCIYDIIQKETKPAEYEDRYIPSDLKHYCDWRISFQKHYRFSNTPYKTYIDFRKNLNNPLFFTIESNIIKGLAQCLNVPHPLANLDFSSSNWTGQHNNNWPLKDGYREDFPQGAIIYELSIDEKEVNRLKENCIKKKK